MLHVFALAVRQASKYHSFRLSNAVATQLLRMPAGGGNVLNVQRTIRQFIAAGAKGCTLEDQKWPKKSGSVRGKEVIGMDEMIAKVVELRGMLLLTLQSCQLPDWLQA